MSATVVAAGAIASTQVPAAPATVTPVDAPARQTNLDLATQREQRLAPIEAAPVSGGAMSDAPGGSNQTSGELEFDR
jgi:hypothetical protein